MRITIIALALCSSVVAAAAQDVSAVREASQKFTAALAGGDAAAAAGMFTDDAIALPPGRKEIKGRSEIQTFLGVMTGAVQDLRYVSEDLQPIGDNAAREVGTVSFRLKARQGSTAQDISGKYLIVWIKSGNVWKISADMWNRSAGLEGRGKPRRGTPGGAGNGMEPQSNEL